MKFKEKVLKTMIKSLEKKIAWRRAVMEANPISDLLRLRRETFAKLDAKDPAGWLTILEDAARREDTIRAMIRRQKKMTEIIDDIVRLEAELIEAKNALFWEENNGRKLSR